MAYVLSVFLDFKSWGSSVLYLLFRVRQLEQKKALTFSGLSTLKKVYITQEVKKKPLRYSLCQTFTDGMQHHANTTNALKIETDSRKTQLKT